jgi:hypothetical protein
MALTKCWDVRIFIDEHDDNTTRAEARLRTKDHTTLIGVGVARQNPHDANVPEIGDELAAARALSELAHQLMRTTAEDIEQITHKSVHLHQ